MCRFIVFISIFQSKNINIQCYQQLHKLCCENHDWGMTMEYEIDRENRDWGQVNRENRDWEMAMEYEIDRENRDWGQIDHENRDWEMTMEYENWL
jgi:hypothetical protein